MAKSRSPTRRILVLSESDAEIIEDALAAYAGQCQKSAFGTSTGHIWKQRRDQTLSLIRKVQR